MPDGWVRTGTKVTGLRQGDGGVTVTWDGGEMSADLVIGADGIRSAVRRVVWPEAPAPLFLGRTAWLGVTDTSGISGGSAASPGDVTPRPEGPSGSVTMRPGGYF